MERQRIVEAISCDIAGVPHASTEAARIGAEYVPRRYVGSVAGRPLYGNASPSSHASLYDCSMTVLLSLQWMQNSIRELQPFGCHFAVNSAIILVFYCRD